MRAWTLALVATAGRLTAPALGASLGLAVAAAIVLTGQPADARTSYDSAYGFDRTWNAAIRLVRVDMGLKVVEKDDTTGYLMFEYKSPDTGNKPSAGSMEFVRSREPDSPVRVVIQLPQMPSYHEQVMLDSLVKKMKTEYGEPPMHPRPSPAQPPSDGGTDGGESPP
jgi:hypothetical protein